MSEPPAALEPLVAVKRPDDGSEGDVFVNAHPVWTPARGVRSIFGGFFVGHAIAAAQETVPAGFDAHFVQCNFQRPGRPDAPLVYTVDRVADGRSFASRLVRATQPAADADAPVIFVATLGFQRGEPAGAAQLHYAPPVPAMAGLSPDDIDPRSFERFIVDGGFAEEAAAAAARLMPFEWRAVDRTAGDGDDEPAGDPTRVRLRSFVRARVPLGPGAPPGAHMAALGFLSDLMFVFTANHSTGRPVGDFAIQTTMNHVAWFHEPDFRVDDWLVCERDSSWGRHGRVLVHQRFWRRSDGRLVMTSMQEGLARLKRPSL